MSPGGRAASAGRRRGRTPLLAFVAAAYFPALAVAAPGRPVVTVSVIGANSAGVGLLRAVLEEQLGDESADIVWTRADGFVAGEIFRDGGEDHSGARVWIDLTGAGEARIYLRAGSARRFVVRVVALPGGLDEMGREAIGQIVRFSALAVMAGGGGTLSAEEARAAVSRLSPQSPEPAPQGPSSPPVPPAGVAVAPPAAPPAAASPGARATVVPPARPVNRAAPLARAERSGRAERGTSELAVEIAPFVAALLFAPQAPLAEEVSLGASARGARSSIDVWSELSYRLPVTWRGEPVGVETSAAALRAGVGWHAVRSSTVSFRMGAGAGVERVTFSPVSGGAAVDLAPSSSFVSPEARLLAAAELRVGRRLALSLRASCDIALLDVHYDVGGDSPRRVLSPFPLRAGLGLGAAWQL